jgi:hypothetical protein
LIKPHLNAHSVHDKRKDTKNLDVLGIDRLFYSQLPKYLIKQLYDTIYEPDFQMLGYEYPQEYIDMGLNDE